MISESPSLVPLKLRRGLTLMRLSGSPSQLTKEARSRRVRSKRLFGAGLDSFLYQNNTLARFDSRYLSTKFLILFRDSFNGFLP